jgi:hypothetical protein
LNGKTVGYNIKRHWIISGTEAGHIQIDYRICCAISNFMMDNKGSSLDEKIDSKNE